MLRPVSATHGPKPGTSWMAVQSAATETVVTPAPQRRRLPHRLFFFAGAVFCGAGLSVGTSAGIVVEEAVVVPRVIAGHGTPCVRIVFRDRFLRPARRPSFSSKSTVFKGWNGGILRGRAHL